MVGSTNTSQAYGSRIQEKGGQNRNLKALLFLKLVITKLTHHVSTWSYWAIPAYKTAKKTATLSK